jgi:hypothetical protein
MTPTLARRYTLGFVALICAFRLSWASQTKGSIMVTADFSGAGVALIGPNDPAYTAELRRLGFGDSMDASAVKQSSVILKNSSSRSIVAFAINWIFLGESGQIFQRGHCYLQPSALLDGGRPRRERAPVEHRIGPGDSRIFTLNGMARNAQELHEAAAGSFPGPVQAVNLDLVVFDDGEAVGPNRLGLLERLEAYVDAEQDLMAEVDDRQLHGESLQQILANIRSRLPSATEDTPATAAALYDHNVRVYLHELEATGQNFGEDEAKRAVKYRRYVVRPRIWKRDDLSGKQSN